MTFAFFAVAFFIIIGMTIREVGERLTEAHGNRQWHKKHKSSKGHKCT